MNIDPNMGGSAAVGAMLAVLLAHYGGGDAFSATEMTALAAGFGAITAAFAAGIRAVWRWYTKEVPTNA